MREDGDFDAYLAARWRTLVQSLVERGCSVPEAERIALEALVRLRPRWRTVRAAGDVDAAVHHELDAGVERRRRARRRRRVAEATPGAAPGGHLPPQLAGQVPPTPQAIAREVRARRRRARRTATAVTVALLLVAGLTGWLLARDTTGARQLARAPTSAGINPAPVAWYANGSLHLDRVVIELPPMRDLALVSGGAVYVDADDTVVLVDVLGRRTRLGSTDPDSRVGVSTDRRRLFFLDARSAELVSLDVATREVEDRWAVVPAEGPPSAETTPALLAVDGDQVFYRDATGTRAWTPGEPDTAPVAPHLLDAAGGVRAFADPGERSVVWLAPGGGASPVRVIGADAQLSEDGRRVLTRAKDDLSVFGTVRIHDVRTGRPLPTGLGSDDRVITARLGPRDTVTYLVARAQDQPRPGSFVRLSFAGPWQLRTCAIATGRCTVRAKIRSSGPPPLLAP
ncbi:hypothetical protein [Nocardioides sp.]|uniref:hypothetical protein n=1 Tax=Nocardioides sp. TaxID=35761 RepID=UPI003569D27E